MDTYLSRRIQQGMGGYYYPGQIILFYPDEAIFVHELAHHYNYDENGNYQSHDDKFYFWEKYILQYIYNREAKHLYISIVILFYYGARQDTTDILC